MGRIPLELNESQVEEAFGFSLGIVGSMVNFNISFVKIEVKIIINDSNEDQHGSSSYYFIYWNFMAKNSCGITSIESYYVVI